MEDEDSAKDECIRAEDHRRWLLCRIDFDVWHRQIAVVAEEMARRMGQPGDALDEDGLWEATYAQIASLSSERPETVSDALLYLSYLADIRSEVDHHTYDRHSTTSESVAIIQRYLWEYAHRNDPFDSLWSIDNRSQASAIGYVRCVSPPSVGSTALILDGLMASRSCAVLRTIDGGRKYEVELLGTEKRVVTTIDRESLLQAQAHEFRFPPTQRLAELTLEEADIQDLQLVSRATVAMLEFARHQPIRDNWEVSKYHFEANQIVEAYRLFLEAVRSEGQGFDPARAYNRLSNLLETSCAHIRP